MTGPEDHAPKAEAEQDSSPLADPAPEATGSEGESHSTDDAPAGHKPVYNLGSASRPRRDFDLAPSQSIVDIARAVERQMSFALEGSLIAQRIADQAVNDAWTSLPGFVKVQNQFQLHANLIDRFVSTPFTQTGLAVERMMESTEWLSFLAVGEQLDRTLQGIADLLPTRAQISYLTLPRNLRSVAYDQEAFRKWMREGIPLAYVLDSSIVDALAETSTPQERRALLSRRRERIVNDCDALLDGITATSVLPYVETARMAIAGYRDGHHQLAQTWAAANLDNLVKEFHAQQWSAMLDKNQPPPKLFRAFFFVGQLRVVMAKIGGDPVPQSFNRQGSVHFTTTRRHFSKLNAMLAIAHLTSAICNYDAAAKQATAPRP